MTPNKSPEQLRELGEHLSGLTVEELEHFVLNNPDGTLAAAGLAENLRAIRHRSLLLVSDFLVERISQKPGAYAKKTRALLTPLAKLMQAFDASRQPLVPDADFPRFLNAISSLIPKIPKVGDRENVRRFVTECDLLQQKLNFFTNVAKGSGYDKS